MGILDLAGVALAALLSENFILVNCTYLVNYGRVILVIYLFIIKHSSTKEMKSHSLFLVSIVVHFQLRV